MPLSLSDLDGDYLMSSTTTDSFAVLLRRVAPELLPPTTVDTSVPELLRHGRTVLAIRYNGGVVVAADLGSALARRLGQTDVDRILGTDDRCVIGVAGAAGLAGEMIRLFQAEVDHLEKIQGQRISMDGCAVRLSSLVRSHGTMMAQGLAVTPLLAGWDELAHRGRIFSYDGTGGKLKNIPMPVWGRELCLQATFSTKTTEQGWIGMNPWRWLSAPLTQLSAMTARRLCRDLICRAACTRQWHV